MGSDVFMWNAEKLPKNLRFALEILIRTVILEFF